MSPTPSLRFRMTIKNSKHQIQPRFKQRVCDLQTQVKYQNEMAVISCAFKRYINADVVVFSCTKSLSYQNNFPAPEKGHPKLFKKVNDTHDMRNTLELGVAMHNNEDDNYKKSNC